MGNPGPHVDGLPWRERVANVASVCADLSDADSAPIEPVQSLLSRAAEHGVTLWAEEGGVRFRCRPGALSPQLLEDLRSQRSQLLECLMPRFDARNRLKPARVFSFRTTTWDGIKKGWIRVDSTNGTHWVGRLRGLSDVDAVERACLALLQRHDALRASVLDISNRPCLSFDSSTSWRLDRIDLQAVPSDKREAQARDLASAFVWQPFDLASGPLFRALLITLAPGEHVLGIVVHHFVADGLSIRILGQELTSLLAHYTRHRTAPPSSEPCVQYSDYLVSMQEWLDGPGCAPHLAYWRDRLTDAPAIVLPSSMEQPPSEQQGARVPLKINTELASAVYETAAALHASPFLVLLAAQVVLVAKLTELDDVTIGSVTLGREVPALQGVVGYLADRVYYRVDVARNPGFGEILERVRATVIDASAHQFVRADIVKSAIGGDRGIVAPMFNYLPGDALAAPVMAPGMTMSPFAIQPPPARSEASSELSYWLELRGGASGMQGHFRFGGSAMPGLAPAFEAILSQAMGRHQCRLHSFRLPA